MLDLIKVVSFDYKVIMPENTKEDQEIQEDCRESSEKFVPGEAQTKRSYYYDDACGYEIYTEVEEDEEEDQKGLCENEEIGRR